MNLKKLILISSILFGILFIICVNDNIPYDSKEKNNDNVEALMINKNDKIITEKQAIQNVKEYLNKTNGYIPPIIDVDSIDGNYYLVHAYEIIENEGESHTATTGWFHVNVNSGDVTDIIN